MKGRCILLSLVFAAGILSCNKSELAQVNPNQPSPTTSLTTEGGLISYGAGILQRTIYPVPNEGNSNILVCAMVNQSIMGDENFLVFGNFGFRYVDQVYQITLPNGNVVQNPFGVTQQTTLQGFNSRQAGDLNAFQYEWTISYFFISQANTLLNALKNPDIQYSAGDKATKIATLEAWAYWWKGYSYSRLGSMYLSGVINNDPGQGNTNGNFVDHTALIVEADKVLDSCATILNTLPPDGNTDYETMMSSLVLSFNDNTDIVTPAMWLRQINSEKARNLLVNKKVNDMQTADWQQISDWCANGLDAGDFFFKFGMTADAVNDLSNGFHPIELAGPADHWLFTSERLIQDFKPGDQRLVDNFEELPAPDPNNPNNQDPYFGINSFSNLKGRGIQFGTRWAAIPIENGGLYSTAVNLGYVPFACTYEENKLMIAEADIYLGNIDEGLKQIDEVRTFQHAGLPAVANTGLSADQAKEELRRERRIGLFMRGLAFYDARRWGITAPVAQGGGRPGAIVYVPGAMINSATDQALPCLMDYSYMDYWDVPQNELDFNAPADGSSPVKN